MGESVSCCGQPQKPDQVPRELITMQNGDACRQALEDFFKRYPKMSNIYHKKPKYCYQIDRTIMFQKQDMICIGDLPETGKKSQMIVMYKEGYFYQGELKDFIREGCGRMISADGDCYEGKWRGNQPEGQGTYQSFSPKQKYTGVWSNGTLSCKGRACYEDGSVYEGDFYQNQRHGKGRIQYADGTVYEGGFKANQMEGFGTLIGINHKYEGSWRGGKMEGAGKSYWYNQDDELLQTYEGQYENGLKHGRGIYRWANGRIFEGEWEYGEIKQSHQPEEPQSVIKTR